MKFRLALIFLLIPFLLCAQTKKHKKKPVHHAAAPKTAMQEFYASRSLSADSAITPYLYYQVYDWIGTNYKYSGETKKGIDCSGFVSEMYKKVYCISLSGGSRDIWTVVAPIEKPDLKEGDILFFKIKKGQISHVGIYLGNNKFAHASVHSGVIVSDLDEEYYKRTFFKGGRTGNAEKGNKGIVNSEKATGDKAVDNKNKTVDKKIIDNKQINKPVNKAAGNKPQTKKAATKPATKPAPAKPADNKIKLETPGTKKPAPKTKK